jgi:SPP1 gp7 family putative phage head morphogenesis protein
MRHLPRKQQLVNLKAQIEQHGAHNTRQFRGKHIKGRKLAVSVRVQEGYAGAITKLLDRMQIETRAELLRLDSRDFVQEHFQTMRATQDASAASEARRVINKLKSKWDQLFGKLALGLSPWFADNVNENSANASRQAVGELPNLKEESKAISIDVKKIDKRTKTILQAATANSADFIKTVPERYLNEVGTAVYKSIAEGQGLKDLVPYLEKHDVKTKNWAHNTAMDQTRKTFNNLNRSRMRNVGVTKGEWIHSGGSQHPRELHEDFDGETFSLEIGAPVGDDGGNMVFPGEEPNCRCTFAPVVSFEDDDEDE